MRNVFWGIILIVLGVLFLLDNMDIADFGYVIRTYWPALLVLWGISILVKKTGHERTGVFEERSQTFSNELFHESAVFGDLHAGVDSRNFKGGSVSTVFGSATVDLSRAVIADGEHWLRLSAVFGDATIVLPRDLAVSVSGSSLFGEVSVFGQKKSGFSVDVAHVSPEYEKAAKRLRIKVNQVFGRIEVS